MKNTTCSLTSALITFLAVAAIGCSAETGDPSPGSEATAVSQSYVITRLELPRPDASGRVLGFNVDGAVTAAGDDTGCGFADAEGPEPDNFAGVDNAAAALLWELSTVLTTFDPMMFNARITQGKLVVLGTVGGVDSFDDDDQVELEVMLGKMPAGVETPELDGDSLAAGQSFEIDPRSLQSNGTSQIAFGGARIAGGRLIAGPTEIPYLLPQMDGSIIEITLRDTQIRFDIDERGITRGVIGGGVAIEDILRVVEQTAPDYLGPAQAALSAYADLDPDASGACTGISIGLSFEATPAEIAR